MSNLQHIEYSLQDFNFLSLTQEYLGFDDLGSVHEGMSKERLVQGTDQGTELHKRFYAGVDNGTEFTELYHRFIREVIQPLFNEPIIFQTFPTFRAHMPENVAVFEFHKDRQYGHSTSCINFFLPLTRAWDTNTFWLESEEDKEDYAPVEANPGQIVMFDGANLRHGNKLNTTGQTRVSYDFRVLKLSDYDESKALESLTQKKKFIIGDYYTSLS